MKTVFFPIETISRELDYRIFLALMVLKENPDVEIYMGYHHEIFKMFLKCKNALYVGKHIHGQAHYAKYIPQLKKNGNRFVVFHEEGAVFLGGEPEWKKALSKQFNFDDFDKDDILLTWGRMQEEYSRSQNSSTKIRVTGHPRFDLYKNKYRSYFEESFQAIKDRYGNFILINTHLGFVNHGISFTTPLSYYKNVFNYDTSKFSERDDLYKRWTFCANQLGGFLQLVNHLAEAFPDKNIVIRPHPSESLKLYEKAFEGLTNVHVIREGEVNKWILACEWLIHDGCTTAIEAYFSEKKIIRFKTQQDSKFDTFLPCQIGFEIQTCEDAIVFIKDPTGDTPVKQREKVERLFNNFQEESFPTVMKEISLQLKRIEMSWRPFYLNLYSSLRNAAWQLRKLIYFGTGINKNKYKYVDMKFPELNKKKVNEKAKRAAKIINVNYKISFLNKRTLVMRRER